VGAGQPVGGSGVAGAGQGLVAGELDQARVFGTVQRAAGGHVAQQRLQRGQCGGGVAFGQCHAGQAGAGGVLSGAADLQRPGVRV